jgi:hypothetical protein
MFSTINVEVSKYGNSLSTENNMDYNNHTKLRIYLEIDCVFNHEVNTGLLILLINVGLCQKKRCNKDSSRKSQYETVIVISSIEHTY